MMSDQATSYEVRAAQSDAQLTPQKHRMHLPVTSVVVLVTCVVLAYIAADFLWIGALSSAVLLTVTLVTLTPTLLIALASVPRGFAHRHTEPRVHTILVVGQGPLAALVTELLTDDAGLRRQLGRASIVARLPWSRRQIVVQALPEVANRELRLRDSHYRAVVVADPNVTVERPPADVNGHRPAIVSAVNIVSQVVGRIPIDLVTQDVELRQLNGTRALSGFYRRSQRTIDVAFSLVVGVPFLLLLPVLALMIRLDSPGPIFYRQQRVGLDQRPFEILKLRTMRQDAEQHGAVWAGEEDPRITRLGSLLRRSRLDELPQVWNILRGQMALVGPRPERPEFTGQLAQVLPSYHKRHSVKPGLTGWAQVRYRYASSVRDSETKLEFDLYYVKQASLVLDIQILIRTVRIVLGLRGR